MNFRAASPPVLAVIALPVLAAVSVALWGAGMFGPPRLLEKRVHDGGVFFTINPDHSREVFGRAGAPSPPPLWVPAEKSPGTRRVVLLGESTAAGTPMPDYHLGRLVGARWKACFPGEPVEVINLSMDGVRSSSLRAFAREAMALDPDMVVLYAGHNEMNSAVPGPGASRLWRAVKGWIGGEGKAPLPRWEGIEMCASVQEAPTPAEMLESTGADYRGIVQMAAERGAKVLFCLPAVNLNDWPPVAEEPPNPAGVEAVMAAQEACDLSGVRSAAAAYEAAKRREADGDMARAWPLYRRAVDLDPARIRVTGAVRDIQAAIAGGSGPGAALVDADRRLHEENPFFAGDREIFLDHANLTFGGRAAAAEMIVDGMAALWGLAPPDDSADAIASWWGRFPEVQRELARDVMFNGYDEHDMWSRSLQSTGQGAFRDRHDLEARRGEMARKAAEIQRRAVLGWDTTDLVVAYERAVLQNPHDPAIHFTAGRLLGVRGEGERAEDAFQQGFLLQPLNTEARLNHAAMQMMRGDNETARASLEILKEFSPRAEGLARMESALLMREGNLPAAATLLESHLAENQNDIGGWEMLAELQLRLGQYEASEQSRQQAKFPEK
ncbi:MAG: hypothetical protein IAE97_12000 [Chthoniobacterales bacterium]|nr:hypothetical protein [Chthoniobacterales bacterium]